MQIALINKLVLRVRNLYSQKGKVERVNIARLPVSLLFFDTRRSSTSEKRTMRTRENCIMLWRCAEMKKKKTKKEKNTLNGRFNENDESSDALQQLRLFG